MEVDNMPDFGSTFTRLIDSHRPQGEDVIRCSPPFGGLFEICLSDATFSRDDVGRILLNYLYEGGKVTGTGFDKLLVYFART